MRTLSLQLRTSCSACGGGLPLNAMVPRLACPACGGSNQFGDDFWMAILGDPDLCSCTIVTGGREIALEVGREDPACAACGTEVSAKDAVAAADAGSIACPKCRAPIGLREPPRQLALSGFRLLVGEDAMQLPAGGPAVETPRGAREPVAFNCPTCGSVLRVDGGARVVRCGYCAGSAYLPDDLWHVFHPVPVTRPWYLVLDPGARSRARHEAEDPATAPERLEELSHHLDYEIREAVARHPRTPEAALRRLVEADGSLATDALDNPSLSGTMWPMLAGLGKSWVLEKIADSAHAPPAVLRSVVEQVAHRLSDDWDGDDDDFDASDVGGILESLAQNPRTPGEVLAEVARLDRARPPSERGGDFDESLAQHPNCPPALLAELARGGDDDVRSAVAAHRRTPVEVLESLAGDAEWGVREEVAKRMEVRPETLKRLGKDEDSSVREAARANPSYPRFNLWKALFGR
jgi:predicted RNA-binding Zn-ribbon protein involved in translation (DUF1610 family)